MMFAPGILIFLSCWNSWLFGEMSMLNELNSVKNNQFLKEIDVINISCMNFYVPTVFAEEVKDYQNQNQGIRYEQNLMRDFVSQLSPYQRAKLSFEVFSQNVLDSEVLSKVINKKMKEMMDQGLGSSIRTKKV